MFMALDGALPVGRVRGNIMDKFLRVAALAFAGMLVAASAGQAAGLYDDDDDAAPSQYRSQHGLYCYKHPYDDACAPYARRSYEPQHDVYSDGSRRCAALVRAVGKRNLFLTFARNSARFAWVREARFVHGDQYADWNHARDAEIACTREGALNSCEAVATPCR